MKETIEGVTMLQKEYSVTFMYFCFVE